MLRSYGDRSTHFHRSVLQNFVTHQSLSGRQSGFGTELVDGDRDSSSGK